MVGLNVGHARIFCSGWRNFTHKADRGRETSGAAAEICNFLEGGGGVMISIKYLLNNLRKVTFNLFKKVKVEKLSEISIFTHL